MSGTARRFGLVVMAAAMLGLVAAGVEAHARVQPAASEVTFEGVGGMALHGTLLVPAGEEGTRWPAVLLLPGSGPTDRDGNQPPFLVTDLLKQLAEALAAEGIASLRFDKRAAHRYQAEWPKTPEAINEFMGWEEFAGDAGAAYRYLRERPEVDASRVGIVGHSEGGLIALQVAHDAPEGQEPAALALLSTAGRPLDALVREQIAALLDQQGADEATKKQYLDAMERAIDAVKSGEPLPEDIPAGLAPLFNASVVDLLEAYFTIDPTELARGYDGPVLVLQGKEDAQVSAERDAPRLAEALRGREGGEVEVVIVEGASHNLKEPGEGLMSGFAGPVVPNAMEAITGWARRVLGD